MKTIWKYQLKETDNVFKVPKGSKILTCQVQYNEPVVWILVDDKVLENIVAYFKISFTGHEADVDGLDYISTLQYHNGDLVAHVFGKII